MALIAEGKMERTEYTLRIDTREDENHEYKILINGKEANGGEYGSIPFDIKNIIQKYRDLCDIILLEENPQIKKLEIIISLEDKQNGNK